MVDISFQIKCWGKELSNLSWLGHRSFQGHLVTGKNSGTHWVKYMICLALAEHYGVEPPEYFNAEATNAFMGNPKNVRTKDGLPRLASSHTIPGFGYDLSFLRVGAYPPTAVLVRDMRDVLVSHYEKWKHRYGISWAQYLRLPMDQKGIRCDLWWYIRFLNRWGDCMARLPQEIIAVRYEDLRQNPAANVERLLLHFGLTIPHSVIVHAVAASSKDAMAEKTDPDFPERIIGKSETTLVDYFSGEDGAYFAEVLGRNLRHAFGYEYAV